MLRVLHIIIVEGAKTIGFYGRRGVVNTDTEKDVTWLSIGFEVGVAEEKVE